MMNKMYDSNEFFLSSSLSQWEEDADDILCAFENLSQRLFYPLNSLYKLYYQI